MIQPYERKDVLIRIADVYLSYDGRPILDHVNAEVHDIVRPGCTQGQVVGILGPSGVGKTVFSRILTGLQEPTSGKITVGGTQEHIKAGDVGFVAQNYPLLRHRTVLGNLLVAGNGPRKAVEEKARAYLDTFNLTDKANVYPSLLSGGQRQRVAIIQQLLCSEHFLVMDEPFTGLDPIMKGKVCDLIRKVSLLDEKNTIFIVAHDIHAVISIADTLWLFGRSEPGGGSSIRYKYDLMERGIAWNGVHESSPLVQDLVREVLDRFRTLDGVSS
jgi:polar amino acid transport system ATP-binding protein/sulfate transport system ATP-binding protein